MNVKMSLIKKSWADICEDENLSLNQIITKNHQENKQIIDKFNLVDDGFKIVKSNKKNRRQNEIIAVYDKIKNCKSCGLDFTFNVEEQLFFKSKGWAPRENCKDCKNLKKKYGGISRINRKITIVI
jgi:hypothetical protein